MNRKILNVIFVMLIASLCSSLIGCDNSNNDSFTLNQDAFNNQNASTSQIQLLDNSEVDHITSAKNDVNESSSLDDQETDPSLKEEVAALKNTSEVIFIEKAETVYATANVNVRSSYSIEENNIVAILKKGNSVKRIAIGKKWSKVSYEDDVFYIVSDYLTLEKPVLSVTPTPTIEATATPTIETTATPTPPSESEETPAPSDTSTSCTPTPTVTPIDNKDNTPSSGGSFVANLSIAADTKQIVCVVGNGGSDCTVSFHKKDADGNWIQQFSTDGDCGLEGITYEKKEDDKKTPAGLYSFTLAFGLKADPGTPLSYRRITDYDYWVDDSNRLDYNTWVNTKDTDSDLSSDHLIDHVPSYNYVLNINYNSNCTPGLGSAIFLHCYNGTGYTTGCIAIDEKYMKLLVQTVDSSTKIVIVPNKDDLNNY